MDFIFVGIIAEPLKPERLWIEEVCERMQRNGKCHGRCASCAVTLLQV